MPGYFFRRGSNTPQLAPSHIDSRRHPAAWGGAVYFKGILMMLIMLLALGAWGCGDDNETTMRDVKDSAKETLNKAMDYSQEQKEKFMKQVKQHWDSLKADVDQLQDKLAKEKDEASDRALEHWKAVKADLEKKQEAVNRAYDELADASGEAYDKAKKKLEAALADLKAAYEKAAAELKK